PRERLPLGRPCVDMVPAPMPHPPARAPHVVSCRRRRAMRSRGQLGQPAEPGRGHEASLAARRAEYAARLRESLERIVASLAALDEVERVSVFGSYARGRVDLGTDLDVLVVMRTDRGFVDRLGALYSRLAVPVDLDLLCYTRGIR